MPFSRRKKARTETVLKQTRAAKEKAAAEQKQLQEASDFAAAEAKRAEKSAVQAERLVERFEKEVKITPQAAEAAQLVKAAEVAQKERAAATQAQETADQAAAELKKRKEERLIQISTAIGSTLKGQYAQASKDRLRAQLADRAAQTPETATEPAPKPKAKAPAPVAKVVSEGSLLQRDTAPIPEPKPTNQEPLLPLIMLMPGQLRAYLDWLFEQPVDESVVREPHQAISQQANSKAGPNSTPTYMKVIKIGAIIVGVAVVATAIGVAAYFLAPVIAPVAVIVGAAIATSAVAAKAAIVSAFAATMAFATTTAIPFMAAIAAQALSFFMTHIVAIGCAVAGAAVVAGIGVGVAAVVRACRRGTVKTTAEEKDEAKSKRDIGNLSLEKDEAEDERDIGNPSFGIGNSGL
ncbi:MAG: hypothetical protein KBD64_04120 [Gammaproteobacteria bacterium]|nr:hypothetical protein [Gammaproteobacteria bacterium]